MLAASSDAPRPHVLFLPRALQQVNCLQITPDKNYIAAAGHSHIRLFEIQSNNPHPVTSYDGHSSNVTAVGFHKDGKWMYTGSEDGTIKIWDLRYARGPPCAGAFFVSEFFD